MKLQEIIEKIPTSREATTIQRIAKCKLLIGLEIEITDSISDIRDGRISLVGSGGQYYSDTGEKKFVYLNLDVKFDKLKFEKQLISLSQNDEVRILAKVESINDSYERDRMDCLLDLLSIKVIKSNQEIIREYEEYKKVQDREDDIKNLKEAKKSGVIAIVLVAIVGFLVFLALAIILSIYNSFSEKDININKIGLTIFVLTSIVAIIGYYNDFNLNRKK